MLLHFIYVEMSVIVLRMNMDIPRKHRKFHDCMVHSFGSKEPAMNRDMELFLLFT
jgi:hypothetical protein